MTNNDKLKRIAEIIYDVDQRCMAADGPVTATLDEMRQDELSEIYKLASEKEKSNRCWRCDADLSEGN